MLVSNGSYTPDSLSDTTPTYGQTYFYPRSGVALTDAFATYGAVYRSQIWIATLVNKLAYGTARLPLKVYQREADDARVEARDTPYARLLRNPNPRHSAFFFWLWTVSTFEVYGEALWVKVRPRSGAAPTQLWPLHPSNVSTRREDGRIIYRYEFGIQEREFLEWGAEDIVHFRSYNPDDQIRGMSRLEPLRQTLVSEDAARRASASMWKNGGQPSVIVSHPKVMSDAALARLRSQMNATYAGVDNWGKIAILEEGANPKVVQLNAEALQFVQSRQMNREEACGMYDVPPPVVHILDRATFSNITEQMRSMYRDTMAPRLGLFESELETQLRPDFDPRDQLYAEFVLDAVLRGSPEQRAVANQSAIFSGQKTPNEARQEDNRPPMPGGDKLYINAGAIPLQDSGIEVKGVPGAAPTAQASLPMPEPLCHSCGTENAVSAQGLCRSCAGKAGRMLAGAQQGGTDA